MTHSPETESILLEKLLSGREETLTESELAQVKTLANTLANTTSRHHYIPQYYIKAFSGSDNLLSVYDKKKRCY